MGNDNSTAAILHPHSRRTQWALALILWSFAGNAFTASVLFIGNSFTFGYGSPVRYYRPESVTDLNGSGQGGVPALFKSFADQAGLPYEVYLETEPGVGIDWHLDHRLEMIGQRAWDSVVMHGFSTLDPKKPGDPTVLIASVRQMAEFLRAKNAKVDIRIMATWPRADQVYLPTGAWYGKTIQAMTHDVRDGYDRAAAAAAGTKVVPVGDAWMRAIVSGVADSNPYDGIEAGKINLWTYDAYHASAYGYYLEALVLFGHITRRDPRSLGDNECSGFELGLSSVQVGALQQAAFDQLTAEGLKAAASQPVARSTGPSRCSTVHQGKTR